MKKIPIRHGDVNFVRITKDEFAKAASAGKILDPTNKYVVDRGEATGSVHLLECEDMQLVELDGRLFLQINEDATLSHTSDHATLTVPPGEYVRVSEREIDWFGEGIERQVTD